MESEYVRKTVGEALAKGLAEVALQRPNDPVEFLALWLLQHENNLVERKEVSPRLRNKVKLIRSISLRRSSKNLVRR